MGKYFTVSLIIDRAYSPPKRAARPSFEGCRVVRRLRRFCSPLPKMRGPQLRSPCCQTGITRANITIVSKRGFWNEIVIIYTRGRELAYERVAPLRSRTAQHRALLHCGHARWASWVDQDRDQGTSHIRKQLTSADPSWWQGMSPMSLPRQLDVPRHGQLTFYTASYRFGRKCTSDPFFQT